MARTRRAVLLLFSLIVWRSRLVVASYTPLYGREATIFYNATGEFNRFPDETHISEGDYNYFISELNFDAINSQILAGAADKLYLLNTNLTQVSGTGGELIWETDGSNECSEPAASNDYGCRNHIRVYKKMATSEDYLFVCGTQSAAEDQQQCTVIDISADVLGNGSIPSANTKTAQNGLISYYPEFTDFGEFQRFDSNDDTYFTASFFSGGNGIGRHFSISYQRVFLAGGDPTMLTMLEESRTIDDNWMIFPLTFVDYYRAEYPPSPPATDTFDYRFYFIFIREEDASESTTADTVYSRVVRICQNDAGFDLDGEHYFLSFMKARIFCQQEVPAGREFIGSVKFQYNALQSMVFNEDGRYYEGGTWQKMMYGAFSGPTVGPTGTAICAYQAENTQPMGDGFQKGIFDIFREDIIDPLSTQPPHTVANMFTECVPGRSDPTEAENQIEISPTVLQIGDDPLLVLDGIYITQMVLDRVCVVRRTVSTQCRNQDVLFLGTADTSAGNGTCGRSCGSSSAVDPCLNNTGKIMKVVFGSSGPSDADVFPVIAEEISLDDGNAIEKLKIENIGGTNYLYVNTFSKLYRVPLERCGRHSSCSECVGSYDPYCVWNTNTDLCESSSLNASDDTTGSVPTNILQNIHTGEITNTTCTAAITPTEQTTATITPTVPTTVVASGYTPLYGREATIFYNATGEFNRFPDETHISEGDYNYFISELNFDAINSQILAGAADKLYLLNTDLTQVSGVGGELNWGTAGINECSEPAASNDYGCRNHIRVYKKMATNEDHLFVCVTQSGMEDRQLCTVIDISANVLGDGRLPAANTRLAQNGLISYYPEFTDFGEFRRMDANDDTYFTASFFSGGNGIGRHFSISYQRVFLNGGDPTMPMMLEESRTIDDWLIFPFTFVDYYRAEYPPSPPATDTFDYRFYFIFIREEVASQSPIADTVYSRVVRICQNDAGFDLDGEHYFLSFMKARIFCQQEVPAGREFIGSVKFQYNALQSMVFNEDGRYYEGGSWQKMMYGAFSGPTVGPTGTAICAYQAENTQPQGDGFQKGIFDIFREDLIDPLSTQPPHTVANMFTECVPGRSDPTQAENQIEIDSTVLQIGDDPLLVLEGIYVTQMVLDHVCVVQRTVSSQCLNQDVLFLGTDTGKILKVVFGSDGPSDADVFSVIAEEISLDDGNAIEKLKIENIGGTNYLYVNTFSKLYRVPLERCSRHSSCSDCVGSRDPYCVWNTSTDLCESTSLNASDDSTGSVPTNILQNIHTGEIINTTCTAAITPTEQTTALSLTSSVEEAGRHAACPGEEVVFTCSVRQSVVLQWSSDSFPEDPVTFIAAGLVGQQVSRGLFQANLTSVTNINGQLADMTSTLTVVANDSVSLNGTVVNCNEIDQGTTESRRFYIAAPPSPPRSPSYFLQNQTNDSATVSVRWEQPESDGWARIEHFNITVTGMTISVNGNNTMAVLPTPLPYNQEITVHVTASNCAGESDSAELIFTIVSCGDPDPPSRGALEVYDSTLEGSEVFYRCNEGLVPEERMTATCGTDGNWSPNPADLVCIACNAEVTDGTFGSYSWPDTPVGSISEISCELGSVLGSGDIAAFATRRCLEGGQWEDPDFSQCADTFDIIEDMEITPSNYEEVVSTLSDGVETAAADPEGQNEENIVTVSNALMETAALLVADEQVVIDVDTVDETVEILDNLQEWNATVVAVASTNIVESIESIVSSYAVQENFTKLVVEGDNLAFVVERVELQTLMESGRGFSLTMDINGTLDANTGSGADNFTELASDEAASVFLPPSLFTMIENMSEAGVFFLLYQTAVLFPLGGEAQVASPGGAVTMVGSPIIAATVAGQMEEFRGLSDPVSILLQLGTVQNITTVTCVSYDFDAAGGRGNWTSEGCETAVIDDGDGVLNDEDIANCSCNHLTNYAVLVDICSRTGGCEISSEAQLALNIISIIGVVLSLFGTIGTIITLLAFKKLRQRDATKFHVQLCIALFCMLLVFLIGIDRNEVSEVCVTVSVLIHYFTLVAVMWMGAEAVLMYQKLVTVFVQITVRYMIILSLVCWLVPIIPAVIPAVVDWQDVISFTDSGDINFCFIGNTAVFFAAFLAPILAVILFNFVIFFIVMFILIRHTMNTSLRTKGQMMDMKTAVRLIVSIAGVMFLFGLTWIFGALTIAESEVSLTFQILFAVFNSLQGFFVFLFFCVFNKDAREAWKGFCCHYSPHFSPSNYTNVHRSKLTAPTSRNLTKTGTYSLPTSKVPTFKNEMVSELDALEPVNTFEETGFEDGVKKEQASEGGQNP